MTTGALHEGFRGLGIAPGLLEVIDRLEFTMPMPIQEKAIPIAMQGQDVIGVAQTGTGKTLAFGIPMVQRLASRPGRGLVLVPTRELALQVYESIIKLAQPFKLKVTALIGGESSRGQIQQLRANPRILIATPGRLNDLIQQREARVDDVTVLVLDEADRMLDLGFRPQIERILRLIPRERQTMLFSATIPPIVVQIASRHMHLPIQAEIAPSGTVADGVEQKMYVVGAAKKLELVDALLRQYTGSVLLFVRTRRAAARIAGLLKGMGHSLTQIHADRTLAQRKEALRGFKTGAYRILVATDVAARGLDVTGIEVVINYDLPDDPENYVHRIGRTGRAGRTGHAVTLATPDQGRDVERIEQVMRASIPLVEHPQIPSEKFYVPPAAAGMAPRRVVRSFGSLRRRRRR